MGRIKFKKISQRKFLDLAVEKVNSPSLRGLIQFGLDVKYSALKNYYQEIRLLPEELFEEILEISGLKKEEFDFEVLEDNWGQKLGGSAKRK